MKYDFKIFRHIVHLRPEPLFIQLRGFLAIRSWHICNGMSAELSLVQDGANTVNPEKIQGATMPYG